MPVKFCCVVMDKENESNNLNLFVSQHHQLPNNGEVKQKIARKMLEEQ